MRIVSGPSLLFASLALSGTSYAAPAATSPRGSDSTATAADRAFLATKSSRNSARSENIMVVENILKPVELVPCGLGISVPSGIREDCPDLSDNIILGDYQPSAGSTPVPNRDPATTTTKMISSERLMEATTSYPPTEPSSVYELDPTPPPDVKRTRQAIPVISAIPPSVPGGPTITAIIGHLSIVLDHPPTELPSASA